MIWNIVHLPFIMAFVLAGASLSRLVLATDCSDANAADLTEAFMASSNSEVPIGLRWFYCVGLGIALFCMGMSFSFKTFPIPTRTIDSIRPHLPLPRTQRIRWPTNRQEVSPSRPLRCRHRLHLPTPSQRAQFVATRFHYDSNGSLYLGSRRVRRNIDP